MDLQFENGLQAAEEGEKKKITQENEALKAQIWKMKIAARNPKRSRADEKLISSLKKKALEYQDDLEKSEASLAKVRAQLAENAKGRAQFVRQMKRKYEGAITSLKRKMTTLENEAAKQARDFKANREHCYDLMARMEEEMQQHMGGYCDILKNRLLKEIVLRLIKGDIDIQKGRSEKKEKHIERYRGGDQKIEEEGETHCEEF
ncbi:uncharacterized protein [Nicotiana sylvestris]|uniref:uncharacterized protein n=1 Tax=Nicotiana sylvestris TaxID=4096 RepID=UPI00388C9EDC